MTAQHTQGPWEVDSENPVIVRDSNGDMIADCNMFQYTDDGEVQLDDCPHNARLIAAAPELLEALRKARWAIEKLSAALSPEIVENMIMDPMPDIDAAIAKATGGAA